MNASEQDPPDGLNPSDLFVRKILYQADRPLTRKEIQEASGLPKRTVLYAIDRLKRIDEVEHIDPEKSLATASPKYAPNEDRNDGE